MTPSLQSQAQTFWHPNMPTCHMVRCNGGTTGRAVWKMQKSVTAAEQSRFLGRCADARQEQRTLRLDWCRITAKMTAVCLKRSSEQRGRPGSRKTGSELISNSAAFWLRARASAPTQGFLSSVESDSSSSLPSTSGTINPPWMTWWMPHWALSLLLFRTTSSVFCCQSVTLQIYVCRSVHMSGQGLSLSLWVLPVPVWLLSRCSAFLPQSENMQVKR